jgi:hypothetical protein
LLESEVLSDVLIESSTSTMNESRDKSLADPHRSAGTSGISSYYSLHGHILRSVEGGRRAKGAGQAPQNYVRASRIPKKKFVAKQFA